ncbi:MAG: alpha/beta hydrolase [Micavibrio aeruginosavorus]|uniref:Alpha/beta hydrolase n=1 Tax=Micavibrio aeruginosavorus TaxID=349221 RepID=A0A2W5FMJ1_9BACT|nr:MAG: alpha/beta hydrolase [Micavibrio aeruginosavorus]
MPEIIINGPSGRIEARYSHSKTPNAPLALILHPFPDRGGTMNHKIPYTLYQTFVAQGFSTLRFNFRGVGMSQGIYDKGEGELSDAAAALDWMQALNINAPYVWIAGYNFGAWIGMQLLMRRPEIKGFVSVCPPANEIDFSFLAPCPQSGLIIQGNKDNIVPEPAVSKLVEKLNAQKGISVDYRVIDGANHFYNEHTDMLSEHVHDYLNMRGVGVKPVALQGLLAKPEEAPAEKAARKKKAA